jgi:hypothetical protein
MILSDQRDPAMRDDLTQERIREIAPGQQPPPLPPLRFSVTDTGAGTRVTVVNDGPLGGRLNGAVRYDVYWCEECDTSTAAGKAAGFARATCLAPSIPATNVDHTQSSALFPDPKYASGFFFVCGVDAFANRSAPTEPARVVTGPVDYTIPGPVQHFQISESGRVANDTVFSELSATALPPSEGTANFGGLQLYLKHFNGIGDVQEAYFHRWLGSGSINFDVLYPIPRRKGIANATFTNGSPTVGAASGLSAVARIGDSVEVLGQRLSITNVTDTAITLASNWPRATVTTTDWYVIALVTVYGVAVSKAGTRAELSSTTPSVDVLMDGELSTPNSPATIYIGNAGVAKLIEWDQVAGSTIKGYNVYRSAGITVDSGMSGFSPPRPGSGTVLIDKVAQNANLVAGSTYVRMQAQDSNFTAYDLEVNSVFTWYVTTTNIRGDESAANYATGTCRAVLPNEIDPTLPTLSDPKNFAYNAFINGTAGNQVLANDTSQDTNTGADASNLPGRPYQSASGQADGTGRFRGYTRLESNDGGTGAAGTVTFADEDEINFPAPGVGNAHFCYGEIGAWDHPTAVFRKIEKGAVYVVSCYLNHTGVTPDGTFSIFVQQMNNGTPVADCLLRTRDSSGVLTAVAGSFFIDASLITSDSKRWYAVFQMDASIANSKQLHYNFSWEGGTVGAIRLKKDAVQRAEFPPPWTPDMGDTTVSIPNPANPTDPVGDDRRERFGDVYLIAT